MARSEDTLASAIALCSGVLLTPFARIGAVLNLKVQGYYPSGKRFFLRFKEKGGKEKELPVHHKLEELLGRVPESSGLDSERKE